MNYRITSSVRPVDYLLDPTGRTVGFSLGNSATGGSARVKTKDLIVRVEKKVCIASV